MQRKKERHVKWSLSLNGGKDPIYNKRPLKRAHVQTLDRDKLTMYIIKTRLTLWAHISEHRHLSKYIIEIKHKTT